MDFDEDPEPVLVNERLESVFVREYTHLVVFASEEAKREAFRRIWQTYDAGDPMMKMAGEMIQERVDRGITTRFLLASAMLASVAFYETVVQKAINYMARERRVRLKLNDLRGGVLERALTFSRKVLGIELHDDGDLSFLGDMFALRNCFLHAAARLHNVRQSDRVRLRRLVDNGDVQVVDGYIVLSTGYIQACADRMDRVIDALIVFTRERTPSGTLLDDDEFLEAEGDSDPKQESDS